MTNNIFNNKTATLTEQDIKSIFDLARVITGKVLTDKVKQQIKYCYDFPYAKHEREESVGDAVYDVLLSKIVDLVSTFRTEQFYHVAIDNIIVNFTDKDKKLYAGFTLYWDAVLIDVNLTLDDSGEFSEPTYEFVR